MKTTWVKDLSEMKKKFATLHINYIRRLYWNILMVILTNFALIAAPYEASFNIRRKTWWTVVKNFTITFCVFDIFLNFITGLVFHF